MLPSRGPIQVTLEETGSRAIQCKPPTQVKILRRPKPNAVDDQPKLPASNSQPGSTLNRKLDSISLNHTSTYPISAQTEDLFQDRLLGELDDQALEFPPLPSMTTTTITNQNFGAQQLHKNNQSMDHLNDQLERRLKLQDQQHFQSHHNKQLHSNNRSQSVGSGGSNSNGKNSIKTYRERADEYAKARLRILGSAFPESDRSLVNSSDINCGTENGGGSGG